MATHVYLVPGFFGFANLGGLRYFSHVERILRLELQVPVHTVHTRPTASLAQRATRLAHAIATTSEAGDDVHIIGHSSGGLDARLLLTPAVSLPEVELDVASRVRTLVTAATPHRGTPSAAFFTTIMGRRMLQLLSLATVFIVRRGHLPREALLALGGLYTRIERGTGGAPDMLEALYEDLLGGFSDERRVEVRAFFEDVAEDRGLLAQISPDAMDAFNAATPDREGVRYGSVITRGRRPGIVDTLATLSPYDRSARTIYAACWAIAGRGELATSHPPTDAQIATLSRTLDSTPDNHSNDAMVPTLSQPWGEIITACTADHLDIIGHLSHPDGDPPHYDWLPSGSGFTVDRFVQTWRQVARFIEG